jgi:molybdopterin-binding protein
MITNDSSTRLALNAGMLITAEIKFPGCLQKGDEEPKCSTENKFQGTLECIIQGKVTTE